MRGFVWPNHIFGHYHAFPYPIPLLPRMTLYGERRHLLPRGGSSSFISGLHSAGSSGSRHYVWFSESRPHFKRIPWSLEPSKWIRKQRLYGLSCPQAGHLWRVGKMMISCKDCSYMLLVSLDQKFASIHMQHYSISSLSETRNDFRNTFPCLSFHTSSSPCRQLK